MDSNDNSTEKEDFSGPTSVLKTDESLIADKSRKNEGVQVESSIKMEIKQVSAVEGDNKAAQGVGLENDSLDAGDSDNVEMKILTEPNRNAGVPQNESKIHGTKSVTDNINMAKDNTTHSSIENPYASQSPPSLPGDNDEKTQSSCISSPHASTPGSTPPSATLVPTVISQDRSPANSSDNTPPSDICTPKPSPEAVPESPSSQNLPSSLTGNCIQQPINVVRNGTIPNAGKPLLSTMSKKLERSAKATRSRKPKSSVAMYESEASRHVN